MDRHSFRAANVASTSPRYELGKVACRQVVVACFSSVKNHNVSGPHLFQSFTTCQKNPFATPRTVLQRAKKTLCNRSQFRTLFLPHRFIKIRPSHQRPVSIEFLTICRIPEFPKSVVIQTGKLQPVFILHEKPVLLSLLSNLRIPVPASYPIFVLNGAR